MGQQKGTAYDKVARLDGAIKVGIIVLVLALMGFAGFYYYDRYVHFSGSIADLAVEARAGSVILDPNDADARLKMANAFLIQGSLSRAAVQYKATLELRPNHPDALFGLAQAYVGLKDFDNARPLLEVLIEESKDGEFAGADKRLQGAYFLHSSLLLRQGMFEKAADNAAKALAIDRTDADSMFVLATANQKLGSHDEAVKWYNQAVRFDPEFADAYQGLETSYRQQGKKTDADWAKGMTLYANKDYKEAIKLLEQVSAAAPDLPQAHWGLGMAYAGLNDREKAEKSFRRSLEIQPGNTAAADGLARLGIRL